MNDIPIFDSLTHPMPNGGWLGARQSGQNSFDRLLEQMELHNIGWALAVGLGKTVGGYQEPEYARQASTASKKLYPVAFVDFEQFNTVEDLHEYLESLVRYGYAGIKIHPRIAGIDYQHPLLPELITRANECSLLVLLCTYCWDAKGTYTSCAPQNLSVLLEKIPDQKLVLLHAGGVQLMLVAEIARHFRNVLLDLSFTLCKYEGSSLDQDLRFLFRSFDRRICIGSDSPEFSPACLRRRFEDLGQNVPREKLENIAHGNLLRFGGLE